MFKAYWRNNANRSEVDTVTVTVQADPEVRVDLDAHEVDDVIKNLGQMRQLMRPAHLSEFGGEMELANVFNPECVCDDDPVLAHSVLHIRDPRYGWLHYVLPRDVGNVLAKALTARQTTRSTGSSPRSKH